MGKSDKTFTEPVLEPGRHERVLLWFIFCVKLRVELVLEKSGKRRRKRRAPGKSQNNSETLTQPDLAAFRAIGTNVDLVSAAK